MTIDRIASYEGGKRSTKPQEWILVRFEDSRPQHGGVVGDAAGILGMTSTALQRALFRARKKGWTGHFTTSRAKAQFQRSEPDCTGMAEPSVYETAQR